MWKPFLNRRGPAQQWGFRLVGGSDTALVLKVEKVLGLNTPAHQGGLEEGDVLVNVQHELVTLMTHPQVVSLIKAVKGDTLEMRVERGDHVVPNMQECFPVKSEQDIVKMSDEEKLAYYEEAMRQGLPSRLIPKFFTTIGKMKVKTPKYNCPVELYSETTMDEMVSGATELDPEKLDPSGPAYEKFKRSKKFDPKRSSVLLVLNDQLNGNFAVDTAEIKEARMDAETDDIGRRI